jgi:hypothetical protein
VVRRGGSQGHGVAVLRGGDGWESGALGFGVSGQESNEKKETYRRRGPRSLAGAPPATSPPVVRVGRSRSQIQLEQFS